MFQLSKRKIIVLLIIWIVLLGMTTLFTFYINSKDNRINKEKKKIVDYNGVDYYSFYDENDLKITEENINEEDKYYSYIKISGLKNKSIEKKINDEIYDYVNTAIQNKYTFVQVSVKANFSNILSIVFYSSGDTENETKYDTYNYNLNTGDEIVFEDLFSNNANISSILYGGYYDTISTNLSFEIQSLDYEIKNCEEYNSCEKDINKLKKEKEEYETKLGEIEDTVQQKIRSFRKSKNKKFYITNYGIVVIDDNNFITLKTKTNSNYFAYYEKYKTKSSIFDNNNGKKNLFMTSLGNEFIKYSKVEYIDDYALIDFQKEYELNKLQIDYIEKLINKYIKDLDKNKFTYLNISGDLNEPSTYEGKKSLGSIDLDVAKCEMDRNYFDLTYKKKLFESKESGNEFFGNGYYDDKDDSNFTCNIDTVSAIIDFDGNIFENIKDIFVDDFDYENYLKQEFYNYMEYRDFDRVSYTDLEKSNHKFKFKIAYGGIEISINDNESVRIYIENIPKEYLKLSFK